LALRPGRPPGSHRRNGPDVPFLWPLPHHREAL